MEDGIVESYVLGFQRTVDVASALLDTPVKLDSLVS